MAKSLIPKDETDKERYYIYSGFVIMILSVVAFIITALTNWFFVGMLTGIFSVVVGLVKMVNDTENAMNQMEYRMSEIEKKVFPTEEKKKAE